MKIANIDKESLQVLKEQWNFKERFRKNIADNDIKSYKKSGFHPLFRRYIFEKTTEVEVKLIPQSFQRYTDLPLKYGFNPYLHSWCHHEIVYAESDLDKNLSAT